MSLRWLRACWGRVLHLEKSEKVLLSVLVFNSLQVRVVKDGSQKRIMEHIVRVGCVESIMGISREES